jgi:hypothetical protein
MGKSVPDVRKAIICFQYVERIKSELIIAARLLGEIEELRGDELAGAEKLMSSLLEALLGEIRIAHNVLGLRNFEEAGMQVEEAAGNLRLHEHSEAIKRIPRAISFITTSGQRAVQTLREKGLL